MKWPASASHAQAVRGWPSRPRNPGRSVQTLLHTTAVDLELFQAFDA
jgi:hypothetical protein